MAKKKTKTKCFACNSSESDRMFRDKPCCGNCEAEILNKEYEESPEKLREDLNNLAKHVEQLTNKVIDLRKELRSIPGAGYNL